MIYPTTSSLIFGSSLLESCFLLVRGMDTCGCKKGLSVYFVFRTFFFFRYPFYYFCAEENWWTAIEKSKSIEKMGIQLSCCHKTLGDVCELKGVGRLVWTMRLHEWGNYEKKIEWNHESPDIFGVTRFKSAAKRGHKMHSGRRKEGALLTTTLPVNTAGR
jgi:hypothetical protein